MRTLTRCRDGFTLVELLIVITIIATLVGMLLLTLSASTSSAESVKVINDLRNLKAAAIFFFEDEGSWPANGNYATDSGALILTSLDRYGDRALLAAADSRYEELIISTAADPSTGLPMQIIGVKLRTEDGGPHGGLVQKKLAVSAPKVNLMKSDGTFYEYPGDEIFINLR